MSKRSRPDLSSRLNATRWPPASSTATVSGAQLVSRPFLSAASTMVEAGASVTTDISAPRSCRKSVGSDGFRSLLRAVRPIDRYRRHLRRARDVAFGLLVAGERLLHQRQLDAARFALGQHRAQILDRAVDVERHWAAVAALEHLSDDGSAHLEHVRAARRVRQQVHDPPR